MNAPPNRKPPRRLAEREGESKLTAATVNPPLSGSKTFDQLEKKLSLALDALLNAIDAYRELKR